MGLITAVKETVVLLQDAKVNNTINGNLTDNDQRASLVQPNTIGRPRCPPIDIEFSDLTYTVPVGRNGKLLKFWI